MLTSADLSMQLQRTRIKSMVWRGNFIFLVGQQSSRMCCAEASMSSSGRRAVDRLMQEPVNFFHHFAITQVLH